MKVRRTEYKNGRFRAKAIVVREIGDIRIVFYSKDSIYVRSAQGVWVVFHRWGEHGNDSHRNWSQFRHLMFYEKTIDFAHCHRLAFRFDIASQVAREPDLEGKTVEILTTNKGGKNEG